MPSDWLSDRPDLQRYFSPSLNAVFIDDTAVQSSVQSAQSISASVLASESLNGADESGGAIESASYPSNSLYLEITGLTTNSDQIDLTVHGTQPGEVYELLSKTHLTNDTWNPEQTVRATTNQDWTPATIRVLDRTNSLLLWCRLWTTNDDNGNGLPDWWEWEHFGSFDQATNANYDAEGGNNLDEYLAGTDPNTVDFMVGPESQYTSNRLVTMLVSLIAGVPSSQTTFADSTNFAGAVWNDYTAYPVTDLGTNEGWHEVWVGLRGRAATSQQTWQTTRVKLDLTPPVLVVTNPASTVLSRPMIQLQGYCLEPLASLSYDLVPSTGAGDAVSNQMAFVTGEGFDTSTWEATTNYWQAFDIRLPIGTNTITLRATDLAGNTSVTDLVYVVDLSSYTNAPAITIDWPQNGTRIGTDTFTWRGHLDDPSAQVFAQWVDATGATNVINGRVGRNGDFWIDGVPVREGTNPVALVATTATGYASATTVSPVRSDVCITFDLITFWEAWGTVDAPDCAVWVNGVEADVYSYDGVTTWSADLHLDLDNLHVQVRTIPASDNAGLGSGTNYAAYAANLGNPDSAQGTDAETDYDPGGLVYIDWYQHSEHRIVYTPYPTAVMPPYPWFEDTSYDWTERSGGSGRHLLCSDYNSNSNWDTNVDDRYFWPSGTYPWIADGIMVSVSLRWGTVTSNTLPWSPGSGSGDFWRVCEMNYSNAHETRQKRVRSRPVLVTGGKPGSTESLIYSVYSSLGYWDYPGRTTVGTLGAPDTNGYLAAALPAQARVAVTPRVKNHLNGEWPDGPYNIRGRKHDLVWQCVATTPTNQARTTVGVGEQVDFSFNPALPVNGIWYCTAGSFSPTNRVANHVHWTAPSNATNVTVSVGLPDKVRSVEFTVLEPTGVRHAETIERQYYAPGQAGAGMHLRVIIAPTNVSFYRVQVMEVGRPPIGCSGYFLVNPPMAHDFDHGADAWFSLGYDNSWPSSYDWARSGVFPPPWSATGWSGGDFMWDIPAIWRVGEGGLTNSMPGWTQSFTLDASGTVTVTKFNHTVTRRVTEDYGVVVPDP